MTRRALCIYNPAARGAPPVDAVRTALAALSGWETSLEETGGAGHATVLATTAASRGIDAVIACGGDGTVNETVNGIAGTDTALAVVRGGTANVWAKEAGLPKATADAVRLVEEGEVRSVDLGRAGERYFLLMAGVGFDASIIKRLSPGLKRRLGAASYVLMGAREAFSHRSVAAEMRANGDDLSGGLYWLLAANTRNYGGLVNITYGARADDGLLDICLLRSGGIHRLAWLLPFVLAKRLEGRAHVLYQRERSLEVRTPGLPVQVDGEYLGETPMRFEVAPGALRAVVPKGRSGALFGAA